MPTLFYDLIYRTFKNIYGWQQSHRQSAASTTTMFVGFFEYLFSSVSSFIVIRDDFFCSLLKFLFSMYTFLFDQLWLFSGNVVDALFICAQLG